MLRRLFGVFGESASKINRVNTELLALREVSEQVHNSKLEVEFQNLINQIPIRLRAAAIRGEKYLYLFTWSNVWDETDCEQKERDGNEDFSVVFRARL